MWWYSGLLRPIADEARSGDLHHDEQWISLDSCELRNVHRTQRRRWPQWIQIGLILADGRSLLSVTAQGWAARTWLQVAWWHRHSARGVACNLTSSFTIWTSATSNVDQKTSHTMPSLIFAKFDVVKSTVENLFWGPNA
jgi:hypothetical protein